ncbi:DUF4198 domain-containing protein [Roseomonas sp. NAR14]|uniref:DUF4198 domain-containing protein n=1 Tax=Roseomonas acroporae TaxID=2937791 RepID=A0A9X1Y922_9PROT|nr:DUF4198 domain-containing protein [Roseomonas acroporae]MCK8784550.1 DUF4198 domain-containing protein [Roseomonas acroporae]
MRLARPVPKLALAALLAVPLLAVPIAADAHRPWLEPSSTVLSGTDAWVSFDAGVSTDPFIRDHAPMQLGGLVVTAPDGSHPAVENQARGRFRSVFDVHLNQPGTWRITVMNEGFFGSWRQNGEQRRFRGTREAFEREVPANAEGLRATAMIGRIETFATLGRPTTENLQPTGRGLELVPVTHPNDLTAGAESRFRLVLDGAPAAGVDVTVIPGGTRYRERPNEIRARTAADGSFAVTLPEPGLYWLGASVRDDKSGIPNVMRNASYNATLEVLP